MANTKLARCPHCQSDADVRPNADYRFKCNLCGRPRVPLAASVTGSDAETNALLKQGHRSRLARIGWQLASVGFAGVSALLAIIAIGAGTAFDWGWFATTMSAFALAPLVACVLAFRAAGKAAEASRQSIEQAWQAAANRLFVAAGGRVTAKEFAEQLRIDVDYATQLMAGAEVQQLLAPMELSESSQRVRIAQDANLDAAAWEETEEALGNLPTQATHARKE
jgi:hypothetical protein